MTLQRMPDGPDAANREWSWRDLIPVAPMVAGAFAFAYVVGYFLAFDISWLPFFTLSEHVVFALRALPEAIGIWFAFSIAFELTKISQRKGWLKGRMFGVRSLWIARFVWIAVLGILTWESFLYNHTGLALTLLLIAAGTFFYWWEPGVRTPFVTLLLSATNMMLVTVTVGALSGTTWHHRQPDSRAMVVKLKDDKAKRIRGHVMFAGNQRVLIYEFSSGGTYLLSLDNIEVITEGR